LKKTFFREKYDVTAATADCPTEIVAQQVLLGRHQQRSQDDVAAFDLDSGELHSLLTPSSSSFLNFI
jgi:hypothetical protein